MPTRSDFERTSCVVALRVTGPRAAVLSAVHHHPHADTDPIVGAVRDDHGAVSLVCRSCGVIADVDCTVGYAPGLTAADDSGDEIGDAEVVYRGRCFESVAAGSAGSGG